MNNDRGQAFLLKHRDDETHYTTVMGVRLTNLVINGDAVTTSRFEASPWRRLADGAGTRSLNLAASGIFTGSAAEALVKNEALSGSLAEYELSFESGERIRSKFLVTRLEYSGDFNGERNYEITLESSGEVTVQ